MKIKKMIKLNFMEFYYKINCFYFLKLAFRSHMQFFFHRAESTKSISSISCYLIFKSRANAKFQQFLAPQNVTKKPYQFDKTFCVQYVKNNNEIIKSL